MKRAVVVAFLALWFLGQTWQGIFTQFEDDDLMNTYFAWTLPLGKLLVGNLTPFTSVYRPVGSALYRAEFNLFGLHPLPFRIVAYILMAINIWLIYRLAKQLSGSTEIGVLAAALGTFHKRAFGMYVNNGTIYDVLCFTFFAVALSFYISKRPETIGRILAFCGLYTLALNSKEMAAVLPVAIVSYELIYRRSQPWKLPVVWIAIVMTAIAFKMKTAAGGSFAGNVYYAMDFSVRQYFSTTRPLLSQLFFLPEEALNTTMCVLILAAVWALARTRPMLMGAVLITLLPLPINFIPYRGFFVMYLPLLGWSIYIASGLVAARDWMWRKIWNRPPLPAETWEPERVFLILGSALVLFLIQYRDPSTPLDNVTPHQAQIRTLRQDLAAMRRPKSVLFLQDDFEPDTWNPLYIVRLTYRDAAIPVERAKKNPAPREYDLAIDYKDGHYLASNAGHQP